MTKFKALQLFTLLYIASMPFLPVARASNPWWNITWRYRVHIAVGANSSVRYDKPVETKINFTQLLTSLGRSGTYDENSLRVIETDAVGTVLNTNVPFQFDKDATYNAATSASGELVILMTGATPGTSTRHFDVYFETTGKSFTPPTVTSRLSIVESSWDEGQDAYRVNGQGITYYYQNRAGGFSSVLDRGSNDWVDFHPYWGSAGAYRGIPNAIFTGEDSPQNAFHPGKTNSTSTVLNRGPLRISVRTATNDGMNECIWNFYARHATMTMTKSAIPYWLLYEGNPGNWIEVTKDYMYRSDGQKFILNEVIKSDFPDPEWTYFAKHDGVRSLFCIHHEDDAIADSYEKLDSNMTILGFGRNGVDLNGLFAPATSNSFSFGFVEDTRFPQCSDSINSIARPLNISVGSGEEAVAAPTLVSPANNAVDVALPPTLIWRSSGGATWYHLQVATQTHLRLVLFSMTRRLPTPLPRWARWQGALHITGGSVAGTRAVQVITLPSDNFRQSSVPRAASPGQCVCRAGDSTHAPLARVVGNVIPCSGRNRFNVWRRTCYR